MVHSRSAEQCLEDCRMHPPGEEEAAHVVAVQCGDHYTQAALFAQAHLQQAVPEVKQLSLGGHGCESAEYALQAQVFAVANKGLEGLCVR